MIINDNSAKYMEEEIYFVEKIVKRKETKEGPFYLVKWAGYPIEQCTWQPEDNLIYLKDNPENQLSKFFSNNKKKRMTLKSSMKIKKSQQRKMKNNMKEKTKDVSMEKQNESLEKVGRLFEEQVKREETASTRRQNIQENSDLKIKIIEKYKNECQEDVFLLKKQDRICEIPSEKVKLLYATQLSLFYEEQIKKILKKK